MNHKNLALALAAMVALVSITAVAFTAPQQALAGGHHNHHNNNGGIKVNQAVNQLNACSDSTCLNDANNSASIHR